MADLNSMTDGVIDQSYLCQSSQIGFLFTGDTIDLHQNGWKEGQSFHSVTKGSFSMESTYIIDWMLTTLRNVEAPPNMRSPKVINKHIQIK